MFDYGRVEKFPSMYRAIRTPVTVDVLEVGLIVATVILLISFYHALVKSKIGVNGFFTYVRITISLLLVLFIFLSNFGQDWEVARIRTNTTYKAGSRHSIEADIGIHIGLRAVNVSLKRIELNPNTSAVVLANETINYNERYHWTWDQGRFGFGPFAGQLQREFRESQYRGTPTPILWIVEYFVIDGEGYRFGRFYRTAGWYAHILLWAAFPFWIAANILFKSVIRYGAYCLMICGSLMCTANVVWISVRNPTEMVIPFENATIRTCFGISFWLSCGTGLVCIFLGGILVYLEAFFEDAIYEFFAVNSPNVYDIYINDATEDDAVEESQAQSGPAETDESSLLQESHRSYGTSGSAQFVGIRRRMYQSQKHVVTVVSMFQKAIDRLFRYPVKKFRPISMLSFHYGDDDNIYEDIHNSVESERSARGRASPNYGNSAVSNDELGDSSILGTNEILMN